MLLLLDRIKAALNKTTSADDPELVDLIDAASAEYAEMVGPLPGTATVVLRDNYEARVLPRNVTGITAATYSDGSSVDLTTIDFDSATGILHSAFGFASPAFFDLGPHRRLSLTVTVGDLPANHTEAIVADVAELWTRTQRSGGGQRPTFGGDGFDPEPGRPLVLFPRIRSLARPGIA